MANKSIEIYTPYTETAQQFVSNSDMIPGLLESWEREENELGYFQASSSVPLSNEFTIEQALQIQRDWLGFEVREVFGGNITFEGYIHGIGVYYEDIGFVRSYDAGGKGGREKPGMFNAVRVKFNNHAENPEFEQDGAGPPTFLNWSETIGGSDTIGKEITNPAKHLQSAKITYVNNGTTYVSQDITVTDQTEYEFSFVTAGDGTVGGRYAVYDVTNTAYVVPVTATGNTALGTFRTITEKFVTPNSCVSIRLILLAPSSAGYAVFDSVRLLQQRDGKADISYTDWATQDESIARHGRREISLDGGDSSPIEAAVMRDTFLQARAWPLESEPIQSNGAARLELYVNGYILRAGWLETDASIEDATDTLSAHVSTIAALLPAVKTAIVDTNSSTFKFSAKTKSLLDALRELVDQGDSSGNLWRAWMEADRMLIYRAVSFSPRYSRWRGRYYWQLGSNEIPAELLRAMSVVRIEDYPDASVLPASQRQQKNDILLESVTVGNDGLRIGL